MVGLKVRRRGIVNAPFKPNTIVHLSRNIGQLTKGTLCRIKRCGTKEAEISPLVGALAGKTLSIGIEFLGQE
jgi:hypothetical protein